MLLIHYKLIRLVGVNQLEKTFVKCQKRKIVLKVCFLFVCDDFSWLKTFVHNLIKNNTKNEMLGGAVLFNIIWMYRYREQVWVRKRRGGGICKYSNEQPTLQRSWSLKTGETTFWENALPYLYYYYYFGRSRS